MKEKDSLKKHPVFLICIVSFAILISFGIFWVLGFLSEANAATVVTKEMITVYASPTCGCCYSWVDYLKENGFAVEVVNMDNSTITQKAGLYHVPPEVQSCHLAITSSGYFIAGHVPADAIRALLTKKPKDIRGIALPGMPENAPGMGDGKGTFHIVNVR